jgi:Rps23 Pro-64 3,4-dihydroxylase Tpa1-like proline 4-hydroxylase
MQANTQNFEPESCASSFHEDGVVSLEPFLAITDAQTLHEACVKETGWRLVMNQGDKHFDIAPAQLMAMSADKRKLLIEAAHSEAASSFSYLYENLPIADMSRSGHLDNPVFQQILDVMNSSAVLELARKIVDPRIDFCDGQLTRYDRGHYLTNHTDDVPNKNRLCAYILSMNPQWRSEWGGLLHGTDEAGNVTSTVGPAFNALRLLKVPQPHFVSAVAPYAPTPRYSITGWFRSNSPL